MAYLDICLLDYPSIKTLSKLSPYLARIWNCPFSINLVLLDNLTILIWTQAIICWQIFRNYWKHVITLLFVSSLFAILTIWQRIQLDECTESNDGLVLLQGGCSLAICVRGRQHIFQIDERKTRCDVALPRPCPYKGDLYMPGQIITQLKTQFLICYSGEKMKTVHIGKEVLQEEKQR